MSALAADDYCNDPSANYAMADLFACDGCHKAFLLFVSFGGMLLCADCWRAKGSPWPKRPATASEIALAEQRNRERMKERGGADKYRVLAGKS